MDPLGREEDSREFSQGLNELSSLERKEVYHQLREHQNFLNALTPRDSEVEEELKITAEALRLFSILFPEDAKSPSTAELLDWLTDEQSHQSPFYPGEEKIYERIAERENFRSLQQISGDIAYQQQRKAASSSADIEIPPLERYLNIKRSEAQTKGSEHLQELEYLTGLSSIAESDPSKSPPLTQGYVFNWSSADWRNAWLAHDFRKGNVRSEQEIAEGYKERNVNLPYLPLSQPDEAQNFRRKCLEISTAKLLAYQHYLNEESKTLFDKYPDSTAQRQEEILTSLDAIAKAGSICRQIIEARCANRDFAPLDAILLVPQGLAQACREMTQEELSSYVNYLNYEQLRAEALTKTEAAATVYQEAKILVWDEFARRKIESFAKEHGISDLSSLSHFVKFGPSLEEKEQQELLQVFKDQRPEVIAFALRVRHAGELALGQSDSNSPWSLQVKDENSARFLRSYFERIQTIGIEELRTELRSQKTTTSDLNALLERVKISLERKAGSLPSEKPAADSVEDYQRALELLSYAQGRLQRTESAVSGLFLEQPLSLEYLNSFEPDIKELQELIEQLESAQKELEAGVDSSIKPEILGLFSKERETLEKLREEKLTHRTQELYALAQSAEEAGLLGLAANTRAQILCSTMLDEPARQGLLSQISSLLDRLSENAGAEDLEALFQLAGNLTSDGILNSRAEALWLGQAQDYLNTGSRAGHLPQYSAAHLRALQDKHPGLVFSGEIERRELAEESRILFRKGILAVDSENAEVVFHPENLHRLDLAIVFQNSTVASILEKHGYGELIDPGRTATFEIRGPEGRGYAYFPLTPGPENQAYFPQVAAEQLDYERQRSEPAEYSLNRLGLKVDFTALCSPLTINGAEPQEIDVNQLTPEQRQALGNKFSGLEKFNREESIIAGNRVYLRPANGKFRILSTTEWYAGIREGLKPIENALGRFQAIDDYYSGNVLDPNSLERTRHLMSAEAGQAAISELRSTIDLIERQTAYLKLTYGISGDLTDTLAQEIKGLRTRLEGHIAGAEEREQQKTTLTLMGLGLSAGYGFLAESAWAIRLAVGGWAGGTFNVLRDQAELFHGVEVRSTPIQSFRTGAVAGSLFGAAARMPVLGPIVQGATTGMMGFAVGTDLRQGHGLTAVVDTVGLAACIYNPRVFRGKSTARTGGRGIIEQAPAERLSAKPNLAREQSTSVKPPPEFAAQRNQRRTEGSVWPEQEKPAGEGYSEGVKNPDSGFATRSNPDRGGAPSRPVYAQVLLRGSAASRRQISQAAANRTTRQGSAGPIRNQLSQGEQTRGEARWEDAEVRTAERTGALQSQTQSDVALQAAPNGGLRPGRSASTREAPKPTHQPGDFSPSHRREGPLESPLPQRTPQFPGRNRANDFPGRSGTAQAAATEHNQPPQPFRENPLQPVPESTPTIKPPNPLEPNTSPVVGDEIPANAKPATPDQPEPYRGLALPRLPADSITHPREEIEKAIEERELLRKIIPWRQSASRPEQDGLISEIHKLLREGLSKEAFVELLTHLLEEQEYHGLLAQEYGPAKAKVLDQIKEAFFPTEKQGSGQLPGEIEASKGGGKGGGHFRGSKAYNKRLKQIQRRREIADEYAEYQDRRTTLTSDYGISCGLADGVLFVPLRFCLRATLEAKVLGLTPPDKRPSGFESPKVPLALDERAREHLREVHGAASDTMELDVDLFSQVVWRRPNLSFSARIAGGQSVNIENPTNQQLLESCQAGVKEANHHFSVWTGAHPQDTSSTDYATRLRLYLAFRIMYEEQEEIALLRSPNPRRSAALAEHIRETTVLIRSNMPLLFGGDLDIIASRAVPIQYIEPAQDVAEPLEIPEKEYSTERPETDPRLPGDAAAMIKFYKEEMGSQSFVRIESGVFSRKNYIGFIVQAKSGEYFLFLDTNEPGNATYIFRLTRENDRSRWVAISRFASKKDARASATATEHDARYFADRRRHSPRNPRVHQENLLRYREEN